MKHGSNGKGRPRGRNNHRKPGNARNQTFDSNGPSVRIRGNAHQVMEKYLALSRDAATQGDRVLAENYSQHAEHYFRILNAYNQNNPNAQRPPGQVNGADDGDDDSDQEEATEVPAAAADVAVDRPDPDDAADHLNA